MPALYSHTTRATGTVLTATIYNGDHQNHIDNGVPGQLDDYSTSVGQMQTTTDPGGVGTESLATSLAGELERIRFVLKSLSQGAQWYVGGAIAGLLGYSRVLNFRAINNSVTPTTQLDMSADAVVLRSSAGGTVVRTATGTITNNISTAGPSANGRDQAGAFANPTWIHFYWIWNGTTLATLSSATAPPTGPTLPTGYTHWAYATAYRFTTLLFRGITTGSKHWYDITAGDATFRLVSNGTALSYTPLSAANLIPPNASRGVFELFLDQTSTGDLNTDLRVRPKNPTAVNDQTGPIVHHNGASSERAVMQIEMPLGGSTEIDYKITAAGSAGGAFIDVRGYVVPNGDV